jgi:hypothetical protein
MPDYREREYPRATVVYKIIRPTTYHLSLTHCRHFITVKMIKLLKGFNLRSVPIQDDGR